MSDFSDDAIVCFVRYLTLGEDRTEGTRNRVLIPDRRNIETSLVGRELYSYGRHFPLARWIPAKRGKGGMWLINGDTWPRRGWPMTSDHQADTRRAIETVIVDAAKIGVKVSSLIVPFSALDGANIDKDSLTPLDIRPDRRETFTHTASMPAHWLRRALPKRESFTQDSHNGSIGGSDSFTGHVPLTVRQVSNTTGLAETYSRSFKLTRQVWYRAYDYSVTNEHGSRGAYVDYDTPKVTWWLDSSFQPSFADDGTSDTIEVTWSSDRHWLGDSLFMATRQRKRMRFVSSFDYNEPRSLYFLAALPASSRAKTVDDAISDLAPLAVKAAIARGKDVKRQGDIFFVPTSLTSEDVYARAINRTRLSMHTRGGVIPRKGELGYRVPLTAKQKAARDAMARKLWRQAMTRYMVDGRQPLTPKGYHAERRAKLVKLQAGLARNEARVLAGDNICHCAVNGYSYNSDRACQTCGLPIYYRGYTADNAERGVTKALADINAWRKESRNRKRDAGYAAQGVRAKGLCYNRALNAWRDAKRMADAKYTPDIDMAKVRATLAIHGTGHTATEVAVGKGNVTYCRGIVRHMPALTGDRRGNGDHAALHLPDGVWFLAVRNTVPRV